MNFDELQKLMKDFTDSPIKELEVTLSGDHVHLSKNDAPFTAPMPAPAPTAPVAAPSPAPANVAAPAAPEKPAAEPEPAGTTITSPMVGTIYLQPKPGQPAYVKVGDHVNKGDVVCVIEAMKMMTEVKSKVAGTINKVLVENEDLVEFGQDLFSVTED